jgi:hypothetical protein
MVVLTLCVYTVLTDPSITNISFLWLNENYGETYLNKISLRPIFVSGIDRCSVYTGWIKKDFLHGDFLFSLYRILATVSLKVVSRKRHKKEILVIDGSVRTVYTHKVRTTIPLFSKENMQKDNAVVPLQIQSIWSFVVNVYLSLFFVLYGLATPGNMVFFIPGILANQKLL